MSGAEKPREESPGGPHTSNERAALRHLKDAEFWDGQALSDHRYSEGRWGVIGDGSDTDEVTDGIVNLLGEWVGDNSGVLEIGCGPGRLLLALAERWPQAFFTGLDISRRMLSLAGDHIDGAGLANVALQQLHDDGFCEFEWRSDAYDLVYAVELFQHLRSGEVSKYMRQAAASLKPTGRFIAQHVVTDRPELAPHNYPRTEAHLNALYEGAGLVVDGTARLYHPSWLWVIARRP